MESAALDRHWSARFSRYLTPIRSCDKRPDTCSAFRKDISWA